MESKNVKVIDGNNIDRDANIICSFDVDGSDYVTYWIERDAEENDNIFVSKLIKNIDGTSSMINIDDALEKEKISGLIRELIKYAVDNNADKLNDASLTLPSGKTIKFGTVLFNKEQNIDVQKTYITTVKKSVTKVSVDFYDFKVENENKESIVHPVVEPIVEPVLPDVVPVDTTISMVEAPVVEPIVVPEQTVTPVVSETPVVEPVKVETPIEPVVSPSVTPVVPVVEVAEPVIPNQIPEETVQTPTVVEPVMPVIEEAKTNILGVTEEPKEIKVEPVVLPVQKPEVATAPEPVPTPVNTSSKLVFDASKETNLNQALGEASNESQIPVENIEPVRDFGVDEPVTNPVLNVPESGASIVQENEKMGFANNKFFMVIAIAFFMASCIFLGYEVFKFFQLR